MQDEVQSADDNKMLLLIKDIIRDHSVAIEYVIIESVIILINVLNFLRFAKKLEEILSSLMLFISILTTGSVCFLIFRLSIVRKILDSENT